MRLIDADALKRSINSSDTDEKKVLSTKQLHEALVEWIDGRATIEAVEVVRCEDCRFYSNNHLCEQLSRFGSIEPLADFYCGFGERRSDDVS